jgi:hypothetical protein
MNTTSFLPEDYLAQKAERRTNIISITLFGVVMIAVIGAFFVTNRKARILKDLQEDINVRYQQAGLQIQELTQLEKQRQEMLDKAVLAGALVERAPRSILLAELINRMPDRLALLNFEMKSEKIKAPAAAAGAKDGKGRLVAGAGRAKTKQEAGDTTKEKVEAPRYKVTITMIGVAPTDIEVSKYMAELNLFPLVRDVNLEFSEQKEIEGLGMRHFKINMSLDTNADVRRINPLSMPRVKNPMVENNPVIPPISNKETP